MHFACGHSYNLRSLGENEKECPICAPQFRAILDIKRAMRSGATEQVCTDCCDCSSEANTRLTYTLMTDRLDVAIVQLLTFSVVCSVCEHRGVPQNRSHSSAQHACYHTHHEVAG